MNGTPACTRDHAGHGRNMPMDRVDTPDFHGWACPGIRPDRSGDCGFQIADTVHAAPGLADAMRESRELRELVSDILAALEAACEYGEFPADAAVDQWRQRAGLDAAPGGTREGT